MLLILVVILAALAIWVASAYNGLVSLKNQVANAWKQINVQLKRRHDLIPNLVETVKGAMQFEKGTLEAVVSARSRAVAVQASSGAGPNVAATAAAEGALSGALGRLLAVVEAYPDLKSTGNVAQLQEELTSTENKIAFARQNVQRHGDDVQHATAAIPDGSRRRPRRSDPRRSLGDH